MEQNQEDTNEPLKGQPANQFETADSNVEIDSAPPQDKNDMLYIVLIAFGICFALPFYSYFMSTAYWQHRFTEMQNFEEYSMKSHMSVTYIVIGLATVLLNNLFLSLVSLNVRIMFGFIACFIAMAIVAVSEIVFHIFAAEMAHSMLFVACAVTAIACAVLQSSFYGFGSLFPKKYTQAIMVGEGLAGFFAAVTRIFVHLTATTTANKHHSNSIWTIAFFLIPIVYIVICFKLYVNHIYNHSPLVHYYVKLASNSRCTNDSRSNRRPIESDTKCGVARTVYPFMVCIALTYVVTVSLHPSIITEIVSCRLGDWMPVLLLFVFSTSDVIGKVAALIPYAWSKRQLILLATTRTAILALILLCCTPRTHPVILGETEAFVFIAALGITNGLSASLPMMIAPQKLPASLKEATGNIMTFAYNIGIAIGMGISFVFDDMRGTQMIHPCPIAEGLSMNATIETTLSPNH